MMSKTFMNLQKEIETNEQNIHSLTSLLTLGDRSIVLEQKKSQAETKLSKCSWFSCKFFFYIISLSYKTTL